MGGKNSYESIKKYEDKVYDKVLLRIKPKGKLDKIRAFAESRGESVNGFINVAIDAQMSGNSEVCSKTAPIVSPTAPNGLVSAEMLKTIQAHIAEVGASETPEVFIARAVNDTIARDRQLKRLDRDKQGKSMWQMPEAKAE